MARPHGTGSITRKHEARYGCPPAVKSLNDEGKVRWTRPVHSCSAPWMGTVEVGWTARGGRRRKAVIGRTKPEVQRKIRDALREAKEREAPRVGGKPTVKSWADTWLKMSEKRDRPTTHQAHVSQVRNWIVPVLGQRRLESLSPADIRALEDAMSDAGRSVATVARARSVLSKMLRDALLEGHPIPAAAFAVERVTPPKDTGRDAMPFDDAVAVLDVARTEKDAPRWVAALLQGLRPAEALGLTWACVDFDNAELDVSWQLKALPYRVARDRSSGFRVPRNYQSRQVDGALHLVRPKTEAGQRIIPLTPWMHAALLEWRDVCPPSRTGLVFPAADGRPRSDKDDRAAWVELQDRARVAYVDADGMGRRFTLYEARHTAATLLRAAGIPDEDIKAILGHATILSTKAYLHRDRARTRAALEKVAERFGLTSA